MSNTPRPADPAARADGAAPTDTAALQRRAARVLADLAPTARELGELFADAGHELALVGGPVRDAFLGRTSTDLDFATSATPDQTQALLAAWGDAHWDIGRKFGTLGARRFASGGHGSGVGTVSDGAARSGETTAVGGVPSSGEAVATGGTTADGEVGGTGTDDVVVEVTTYRSDQYDPDSRKPRVAFGDTLEGDLSRRDFTVNAMAVRLPDLAFVDPFGGLADLAARRLRTPVGAEQSFDDDPLRMMRAARFAAQLGFTLDDDVRAALEQMASRIEIVSAERVRDELTKLMLADSPRRGLQVMVDSGLAEHVLPELPALRLEIDEHHRHKDVYQHSMTVLEQAMDLETGPDGEVPGPDLVLRLAALLHDVGKPATRRFESGGGVSFHHHEVVGAKLTARRLKALRFDKETVQAVARLTELHLRFHGYGEARWSDSAVRRYVTDAGPLLERLHRLTRSDCTTRNRRKAERLSFAYDDLEARIAELRQKESLAAIRPDLDGTQIMEILGIGPGREVGEAYRYLLDLRMEHGPQPPEVAEQSLRTWWSQHPHP